MYVTVSCWFISAVGAHVHNTIHGPLIDRPCTWCFWCGQIHYLDKWKGVVPWKSRLFWATNGIRLTARCHFTGTKTWICPHPKNYVRGGAV
jgi:hypothetical protein